MNGLSILRQSERWVAVDKPSRLLVHRTQWAPDRESCLTLVRDQLGKKVYPIHRLDRATSGVVLFALDRSSASELSQLFRERQVRKIYYAVVRGYAEPSGLIEKAVKKTKDSAAVDAQTAYTRLATAEMPWTVGKFPSGRYSLMRLEPRTGRFHQLRKHMHSVSHPIVGDTIYGDGKHNRAFREHLKIRSLMLAARAMEFTDPKTSEKVRIEAPWNEDWEKIFSVMGWRQWRFDS